MASPSKRIRLSPKSSQSLTRTTQDTQESKVTSTPIRSSGNLRSPNISTISSNRTVRTRLSDVFELDENREGSNSASISSSENIARSCTPASAYSEISYIPVEEDYDAYFSNLGRVKYTGTVWKLYKPLAENTLYDKILRDPSNTQEIVAELFSFYNRKPERVVQSLIKLCLDIASFQNFDLTSHYKYQENSAKEIIRLLESDEIIDDHETLKSTGRYLFMESRTSLVKTIKMAIYNFFKKLVLAAHDCDVLYDEFFTKNLFTFVKCMSFSNMLAVRHTGVIIAMKILSALVITYNKIIQHCNMTDESFNIDDSEVVRLQSKKEAFNTLLEYFYFIFVKNCRLQENKMLLMRTECIRELQVWVKYFPKIFISELQVVNFLTKLIVDTSKDVRYAALEACERFAESPIIVEFLKPFMHEFIEVIGRRFYDIDYKVAVKAIDIFTILLQSDETFVSTHRFELITSLVFDKLFPVGEAASRFLTKFLQVQGYSSEFILEKLAKISLKPGDCSKQLVVEGFLLCCKETQNWQLYLNLLLGKEIQELQIRESLAEMLAEAIHQTLIGKSTKMRTFSRKVVDIDSSEHQTVAKLFPAFNKLLQVYGEHPIVLIEILKIFPLVNTNVLTGNCSKEYIDILSTINTLFGYHSDKSLLNKLAETMYQFSTITDIAERTKRATEILCCKHVEELQDFLTEPTKRRCTAALRVSILYSHFDLNEKFTWEVLSDCWADVNEKVVANLMLCCKWFLVWNLRNLSDLAQKRQTKELPNLFTLLLRTCNEFTSVCFNMIQHLRGEPLHFQVYETICDFYILYSNELETPIKFNKQFEDLRLKIEDPEVQKSLTNFLNERILSNKAMEVQQRREHVIRYVDLVHCNILPIEALANIFKFYHVNYDDYGSIIECSLSSIAQADDENTVFLVMVYTLTVVYEDILRKYSVVDINSDEAKHLKLLVKQFIAFKHFCSPKRQFKKLLYFAIKYSFKDEAKYAFLYFIRYFIDLINDTDDQKEMFDFFKQKIPQGAEKNDAVLFIGNYLKNISTSRPAKKPKRMEHKKLKENIEPKKSKADGKRGQNRKVPAVPKKRPIIVKTSTPTAQKNTTLISSRSSKTKKKAIETETESSDDDITIHDSESDDFDISISGIRI